MAGRFLARNAAARWKCRPVIRGRRCVARPAGTTSPVPPTCGDEELAFDDDRTIRRPREKPPRRPRLTPPTNRSAPASRARRKSPHPRCGPRESDLGPPLLEGTQEEDDDRPYTVPGDGTKKCPGMPRPHPARRHLLHPLRDRPRKPQEAKKNVPANRPTMGIPLAVQSAVQHFPGHAGAEHSVRLRVSPPPPITPLLRSLTCFSRPHCKRSCSAATRACPFAATPRAR